MTATIEDLFAPLEDGRTLHQSWSPQCEKGLVRQRILGEFSRQPLFNQALSYLNITNAFRLTGFPVHLSRWGRGTFLLLAPVRGHDEELASDLNAGVAALERVRVKLAQYRASVLKATVEGSLTAEWPRQHPQTEPATELLKRVLAERRCRWEEEQLRKFRQKGQKPAKDWKSKYKEPAGPDTTNLAPLLVRWCWVTVGQLGKITSGQTPPGMPTLSYEAGSVAWFRVGDMNATGNDLDMVNGGIRMSSETANRLGLKMLPAGSIYFPSEAGRLRPIRSAAFGSPRRAT